MGDHEIIRNLMHAMHSAHSLLSEGEKVALFAIRMRLHKRIGTEGFDDDDVYPESIETLRNAVKLLSEEDG